MPILSNEDLKYFTQEYLQNNIPVAQAAAILARINQANIDFNEINEARQAIADNLQLAQKNQARIDAFVKGSAIGIFAYLLGCSSVMSLVTAGFFGAAASRIRKNSYPNPPPYDSYQMRIMSVLNEKYYAIIAEERILRARQKSKSHVKGASM